MRSPIEELRGCFRFALRDLLGDEAAEVDPQIAPTADARHGDYQCNVAMGLAKRLRRKPRDIAGDLIDTVARAPGAGELFDPPEIAGPGFVNLRLRDGWLGRELGAVPADDARLGIEPADVPDTVVVDYSSPNVAKQMHVGHLRSTIIGDAIARLLAFEGHRVIRQNHVGDWGTQFGMLCAHLKETMPDALSKPGSLHISDLDGFYREANRRDGDDPEFHARARAEVVALHEGSASTLEAWRFIVNESRRSYAGLYDRLGVDLGPDDERGESFYASRLSPLVAEMEREFADGHSIRVAESDGALCVFLSDEDGEPRFRGQEGDPLPLIVRKSDGAYLYATTDLAALRYRIDDLGANRVIYVTDARQALHFEMLFATAEAAGWTKRSTAGGAVSLEHVPFGAILGDDRKPLKTRTGENVKLADLLDEAVQRSLARVRETEADPTRRRGLSEAEMAEIGDAVGIGAVKYADLSNNLRSDYVFSWDRMLALDGNTAPYLLYAYARIRSIYRRQGEGEAPSGPAAISLDDPHERRLALCVAQLPERLDEASATLRLNLLTEYAYDLASTFMQFYESCPVLKADSDAERRSRLALCDLSARTLALVLGLLGIRVVERM